MSDHYLENKSKNKQSDAPYSNLYIAAESHINIVWAYHFFMCESIHGRWVSSKLNRLDLVIWWWAVCDNVKAASSSQRWRLCTAQCLNCDVIRAASSPRRYHFYMAAIKGKWDNHADYSAKMASKLTRMSKTAIL